MDSGTTQDGHIISWNEDQLVKNINITLTPYIYIILYLHGGDIWLVPLAHHEIYIYMHIDWISERQGKSSLLGENNDVM